MNISIIFTLLFILISIHQCYSQYPLDPNAVYSIAYTRSFRPDLIQNYIGCGYKVAYGTYLYPHGFMDMALLHLNPTISRITLSCQPKQVYLKMFGYAQDYSLLTSAQKVLSEFRTANYNKYKNVILDWKHPQMTVQVRQFLQYFLAHLQTAGIVAYLKVPASYLCKQVSGQPFILGIQSAKRIIVQMYGQDPDAYSNLNQMFLAQQSPTSDNYPNKQCPKFPSYTQLIRKYPKIDFYIEKTLQQQQSGYVGLQMLRILHDASSIYLKPIFYDAFPPNIIRI